MSSGHDEDDERFARVWDERDATGRPPRPDRGRGDDELARDLDIAAALRAAGRATPGPDPEASARMRAAVMAGIGAPQQEGTTGRTLGTRVLRTPDTGPAGGRGAGRAGAGHGAPGTRPAAGRPAGRAASRRSARRLTRSMVTGACAILLLGALTVLLSRGALPGEMLYGIKRASESAEIGLTSGQEAKGLKHLEFASTRLEEVSDLIGRQGTTAAGPGPVAAGLGPDQAALVLENLRSFDEQARTGSRLILPLSAQPSGPSPAQLQEWARAQSARLDTLSPSLDGDGRAAAASSQEMLQRLDRRAGAYGGPRPCATGSASDDLGPLPSTGCAGDSGRSSADTDSTLTAGTQTSTSTTTTTTTTTTRTSTEESSSRSRDTDASDSSSSSREERTSTPAPVNVPLPVPLLPQVDLPPLLPGLPGLSLGG
ncbi:hypothetical protein GCM10023200_59300 [Actinomycetospora chlora]|uniref:DUF5667 domain-containing protein n=1 Tax=Actinomycetospora chlora TaxID=663608 RepID=A0ABP9CLB3_9PSEU